jgi:hypothetical protein
MQDFCGSVGYWSMNAKLTDLTINILPRGSSALSLTGIGSHWSGCIRFDRMRRSPDVDPLAPVLTDETSRGRPTSPKNPRASPTPAPPRSRSTPTPSNHSHSTLIITSPSPPRPLPSRPTLFPSSHLCCHRFPLPSRTTILALQSRYYPSSRRDYRISVLRAWLFIRHCTASGR